MSPTKSSQTSIRPAELNPYHLNPRVGKVPLIVESLKRHGQYKPLVVNTGTKTGRPNEVLAGNQTLAAALQLGLPEVLAHWIDVDDDEAARIVLIDNRASDLGGYDSPMLAELLSSLDGLDGTGYTDGDLTRLLNGLELGDGEGYTDPDVVPATPKEARTKRGDVWILGRHRLVCGDSTQSDVLQRAAGTSEIDAMWTDPPYGIEYVGKTKDAMTIDGDDEAGLAALLLHSLESAATVLRPGAPCYVATPPGPLHFVFYKSLEAAGYLVRQNLIWVKNALVLGRSDYQYKHEPVLGATAPDASLPDPEVSLVDDVEDDAIATHEPVLYGFTPGGSGRLGRGGANWFGNNKQTSVFEVAKPPASRDHPTMKPVELIVQQLRNSVVRGGTVLDMFAGSGSTLIAAHQLNIEARLVEISPAYCDVICRRYQEHTKVMPILESTGNAVDFTEGA